MIEQTIFLIVVIAFVVGYFVYKSYLKKQISPYMEKTNKIIENLVKNDE